MMGADKRLGAVTVVNWFVAEISEASEEQPPGWQVGGGHKKRVLLAGVSQEVTRGLTGQEL